RSVAVAGQPVEVRNSDQTLHNIHAYRGSMTVLNQAQIAGSAPVTKVPKDTDIWKLKCDVHPWMTGYVAVSQNPYFAVTGDDGRYLILNVPPGRYVLEAWHEKFGKKSTPIVVAGALPE